MSWQSIGRFHMHVSSKSDHAGVEPELARSAIEEIARKVIKAQQLGDHSNGPSVDIGLIEGRTSAHEKMMASVRLLKEAKETSRHIVLDIHDEYTGSASDAFLLQTRALQQPMEWSLSVNFHIVKPMSIP
ncbi:peptidase dimerization domain-containing protein [Domibacillus indicus]|uniref:peptidase dimerization domain-containing protein n=1 Tax=Domibacillus indicus TaxID=1437523 RepID=UPI0020415F7B|nr:peptidase dimerization domain-containing protein [Domibacillus indicus]MCM3789509.1 peptidase dimerization domain-containing protein [Domibacillus indicus]